MKKILIANISFILLSTLAATIVLAQNSSTTATSTPDAVGSKVEIHINDDGRTLIHGAKVTSIAGNVINATINWGQGSINLVVNTDNATKFTRRKDGQSSLSEISVGDYFSFEGKLIVTSPLTFGAASLRDWSIQEVRRADFSGKVTSVNAHQLTFALATEERGSQTVSVNTNTKIIKDGVGKVGFGEIKVGDKVRVAGLWNSQLNTVAADEIHIFVDKEILKKTFEGKLKSVTGTTAPTSIVITTNKKDLTVNIAVDTAVVNRNWEKVSLSALKVRDTIRVYGTLTNSVIIATIVHDASLK